MSYKRAFLTAENFTKLFNKLWENYNNEVSGKLRMTRLQFKDFLYLEMEDFAKNIKNDAYAVSDEANYHWDFAEAQRNMNAKFSEKIRGKFMQNTFNPFRETVMVGASDDRREVKMSEMMPEDYGTLNLWQETELVIDSTHSRNNNQRYRKDLSYTVRNYDRNHIEGLAERNEDHVSLVTPLKGYNMNTLFANIGEYKKPSFYG